MGLQNLPAQISISFCSSSGQVYALNKDNEKQAAKQCRDCDSFCDVIYHDLIGGEEIGVLSYKVKGLGDNGFKYLIKSGKWTNEDIEKERETNDDLPKLKHIIPRTYTAEVSGYFDREEFEKLYKSSWDEFKGIKEGRFWVFYQKPQFGQGARVICSRTFDKENVLHKNNDERYLKFLDAAVKNANILQGYERQELGNTISYRKNNEYPVITLSANPLTEGSKKYVLRMIIDAPVEKKAPELTILSKHRIKEGRGGQMDTLIMEPTDDRKFELLFGLDEESELVSSKVQEEVVEMERTTVAGRWEGTYALSMKNHFKPITLEAKDEHGYSMVEKYFLILHERRGPNIIIDENEITENQEVVILQNPETRKYRLPIRIEDQSFYQGKITIGNQQPIEPEGQVFNYEHPFKREDANSLFSIYAEDYHGTESSIKLRVILQEQPRKLYPVYQCFFKDRDKKDFYCVDTLDYLKLDVAGGNYSIKYLPSQRESSGQLSSYGYSRRTSRSSHSVYLPLKKDVVFSEDFELTMAFNKLLPSGDAWLVFNRSDSANYFFVKADGAILSLVEVIGNTPNILAQVEDRKLLGFREKGEYEITVRKFHDYLNGRQGAGDLVEVDLVKKGMQGVESIHLERMFKNSDTKLFEFAGNECGIWLDPDGSQDCHYAIRSLEIWEGNPPNPPENWAEACFPLAAKADSSYGKDFFENLEGDYVAFIIANENYRSDSKLKTYNKLPGVITKAKELEKVLKEKTQFNNVHLFEDFTQVQLNNFVKEEVANYSVSSHKILIYFIGHGNETDIVGVDGHGTEKNYIKEKLSDFKKNKENSEPFFKEVLFVVDACYSGASEVDNPTNIDPRRRIEQSCGRKSRTILTSAAESLSYESEFTVAFTEILKKELDKEYFSIDQFYRILDNKVQKSHPTISNFGGSLHEQNGSFYFLNRKKFKSSPK